ncbi:ExbD/TolR family protein [Marinomonas epiphytica]
MPLNLGQPKRKQAISLTPLIDVVFILLLFFMLTSSFVPWRIVDTPLSSPETQSSADPQEHDSLTLTLQANDGRVWLEGQTIELGDLAAFTKLVKEHPEGIFIVKAESGVTLQSLMSLADRLKQSGAQSVSIANAFTTPESP